MLIIIHSAHRHPYHFIRFLAKWRWMYWRGLETCFPKCYWGRDPSVSRENGMSSRGWQRIIWGSSISISLEEDSRHWWLPLEIQLQLHKLYRGCKPLRSRFSQPSCRWFLLLQWRCTFWESEECAVPQTSTNMCCWSVGCFWRWKFWSIRRYWQDYNVCGLPSSPDPKYAGMLIL
jgi:hypothetical protein